MSARAETRELTPALIRGRRGSVALVVAGELAPGLEGQLLHHVFADGASRRESTVVLTAVPEGIAFAPALVCRDRRELGGGSPAQLPAERWQGTELESTVFNRRYRLLTLKGQDPIFVRELFSPALIAWLAHDVPEGFSFELNERHLVVALSGRLESEEEVDRLRALASEVRRRIREEALEEGPGGAVFDESERRAQIEAALGKARFKTPPASVGAAMAGYRSAARRRPSVLLSGLMWAALAFTAIAAAVSFVANPFFGLAAGAFVGWGAFGIAHTLATYRYRWGSISVSRLGLEAFLRGYGESHGLREQDRWRFHSDYRRLPLPGVAAHVFAGTIPESRLGGLFLTLGDAAELRSRGEEIAYTTDRPLAAIAIVAELEDEEAAAQLVAMSPPEGCRVERDGATAVISRAFTGSLCFNAAEFDRFRAAAGRLLAQVGEDREDAAVAAVAAGQPELLEDRRHMALDGAF